MIKILFERTASYLPEIAGYKGYLSRFDGVEVFDSQEMDGFDAGEFDVIWRFMGLDRVGADRFLVHEYNSLSTGLFPRVKNRLKRALNARCDFRLFLNNTVQREFGFTDGVPFAFRDMGIGADFFRPRTCAIEYDFVYAGSVSRSRGIHHLLAAFETHLRDSTLLVVGAVEAELAQRFGRRGNVTFTGRVDYQSIPDLVARARCGINYMPDRYPYNQQTATKLVEYCALGLEVASSDYAWSRAFAARRGGTFFWLRPDLANLTPAALKSYPFKTPDVTDLEWMRVIEDSGAFRFLPQLGGVSMAGAQ